MDWAANRWKPPLVLQNSATPHSRAVARISPDLDSAKHPAIQQADAQREKEANRKRYLLVFPAAVIGITVALIIITRRRK